MSRFLFLVFIFFGFELYTFFAIRTLTRNKIVLIGFWVVSVAVYVTFFYLVNATRVHNRFDMKIGYAIAMLLTWALPKFLVFLPLFLEDIYRLVLLLINKFSSPEVQDFNTGRRKFISQIALSLAAIPFTGFIYGVFKGKYNFRVIDQEIEFDDLPDAFDGFTITQISDIHAGGFDNKKKIKYAVDLINEQQSDVILYTGDIVNGIAEEMDPWIDTFKQLRAKRGIYSVLGNHDYGYYAYGTKELIDENHEKIIEVHKKIGFDLLLNEHRTLEKDGEKLHILGVENWGASRHFPKKGSLEKASEGIDKDAFKVLLSHDPSHFDYTQKEKSYSKLIDPDPIWDESNIIDFHKKIQLTLAGHTHGMQFGVEIPFLGIKWSPVKYRYPKWAGLYKEKERYLYVNRGFGVLGFPGRVGIWPEITVLTLRKK